MSTVRLSGLRLLLMRVTSVTTWLTCNLSSLFHIYFHVETASVTSKQHSFLEVHRLHPLQNISYFLLTPLPSSSINARLAQTAKAHKTALRWILLHFSIHLFFQQKSSIRNEGALCVQMRWPVAMSLRRARRPPSKDCGTGKVCTE